MHQRNLLQSILQKKLGNIEQAENRLKVDKAGRQVHSTN
jgi:hypothetical protein